MQCNSLFEHIYRYQKSWPWVAVHLDQYCLLVLNNLKENSFSILMGFPERQHFPLCLFLIEYLTCNKLETHACEDVKLLSASNIEYYSLISLSS